MTKLIKKNNKGYDSLKVVRTGGAEFAAFFGANNQYNAAMIYTQNDLLKALDGEGLAIEREIKNLPLGETMLMTFGLGSPEIDYLAHKFQKMILEHPEAEEVLMQLFENIKKDK